jgi:hypothetical protein
MLSIRCFASMSMLVLFLFSAAGSSVTASTSRTAIHAPSSVGVRAPRQSPPAREDIDKKMLAWILLLMKDGRGAR